MTLQLLAASVVLGLVHILLAGHFASAQRGYWYSAGPRDEPRPALSGTAARLDRASRNFLETFPFFAAALLGTHFAGQDGWMTELGAQLYFWGRVAYLPLYAAGIPLIRSLAWNVATAGILLLVIALLL